MRSTRRLLAASLIAAGCSGGAEQAIIGQFFAASRLVDRTALEKVATVAFDPRTQGTVTRFSIQRVSPERGMMKEVTLSATVHLPSGETRRKTLVITMRREMVGRWIVTGFRDAS